MLASLPLFLGDLASLCLTGITTGADDTTGVLAMVQVDIDDS